MLPTAKGKHVSYDYVLKHMKITNPDGPHRTNRQLCGELPLEECADLMYKVICEADDADVVRIHCRPARRALKKRFVLRKAAPI